MDILYSRPQGRTVRVESAYISDQIIDFAEELLTAFWIKKPFRDKYSGDMRFGGSFLTAVTY